MALNGLRKPCIQSVISQKEEPRSVLLARVLSRCTAGNRSTNLFLFYDHKAEFDTIYNVVIATSSFTTRLIFRQLEDQPCRGT